MGPEVRHANIQDDGFATFMIASPKGVNPYFGRIALDYVASGDPTNAIFFFIPDLRRTPTWTWRRTVSRALAKSNTDVLGIELDWDHKGGIIWSAAACNGVPAVGIRAKLSSKERMYYLEGDQTLSSTREETSTQALGVVINAEPGLKSMELERSDGVYVGHYDFQVAAGAITTLALSPGPADPD